MNDINLFRWVGRTLRLISIIILGTGIWCLYQGNYTAAVCFGLALLASFHLELMNWRRRTELEEDLYKNN